MGLRIDNIKMMYQDKDYILISLVSMIAIGAIFWYFTNLDLIKGNMGIAHAYSQIVSQTIITLLFGLNISLLVYKIKLACKVKANESASSGIGTILAVLVAGCAHCGITLGAYLGLGSILSALPFYGLELKMIGLLLLAYSSATLSKNLNNCDIRKYKVSSKNR